MRWRRLTSRPIWATRARCTTSRTIRPHAKYIADFVLKKANVRLLKEEIARSAIQQFVRLRLKMYSFGLEQRNADGSFDTMNKHGAKGIQSAPADKFTHQQYKAPLEHPEENYVGNRRLGSRLNLIYGIEVQIPPVMI